MVRILTSSTPNSFTRVPKSTKVGVVSIPSVFHGRSYGAKSNTTLSQNTRKINLFVAEVCLLTFGLCGWNPHQQSVTVSNPTIGFVDGY